MQLVAYGAQDVYLTGNPQITFFKVVYRRHTNFSMECIEQPIDAARFGGRHTVQVLRNGDLAGRMYVKLTLPSLNVAGFSSVGDENENSASRGRIAWVSRVGHAIINTIECTVGGSQVDKHWGTWYDLWYDLTHTEEQTRGYDKLIGNVPELTVLNTNLPEYTLYVPLQFWFNRNTGLALPLIALQYHEVRFNIEFSQRQYLLNIQNTSDSVAPQILAGSGSSTTDIVDASILVDYIYLDQEERRRMAQVGHEYLIEQVQFSGTESVTGSNQKVKLDFNHPCKELVWAINSNLFTNNTRFLTYYVGNPGDAAATAACLNMANVNLATGMLSNTNITSTGNTWTQLSQSTVESVSGNSVGIVNFVVGAVTFTAIVTNASGSPWSGSGLWVPATGNTVFGTTGTSGVDLAQKLREVQFNLTVNASGSVTISDVQVLKSYLNLADASLSPTANPSNFVDNRSPAGKALDVYLQQPFNYGADLAGQGNLVSVAKLQLNGHDRFDEQPGEYFNYVQPYQHHTHTPADGVNVYSFGLHPEQHQPSGTANLSRIDTTLLWLQMTDPFSPQDVSPGTSSYAYQSLDFPNAQQTRSINVTTQLINNSNIWIFAFSYNVFRIMSGMGGLAYAN